MIKFMLLFRQPEDINSFENFYADFLGLVERIPDIARRQVIHPTYGYNGAPEFYRILELYFDSREIQEAALNTDSGQEAGRELRRLPDGAFDWLVADVYEEAGGNTPAPSQEDSSDAEAGAPSAS